MSLEPLAMGEIAPEATLEDCEQALRQIERGAAIAQGQVLKHIRDNRLYKDAGFASFEDWCEKHYGYTRDWAYKRIDLAETRSALLSTNVDTPEIATESHARAIKPVLRDHGPEVAAEVLREAADDDGRITARSITEAAVRVIEPEVITAEEFVENYLSDDEVMAVLDQVVPERPEHFGDHLSTLAFRASFSRAIARAHGVTAFCAGEHVEKFDEEMRDELTSLIDSLRRRAEHIDAHLKAKTPRLRVIGEDQ